MVAAHRYTLAALAAAQAGTALAGEPVRRFELTPHVGYRAGGEITEQDGARVFDVEEGAAQGVIFDVLATADSQWEALFSRQRTRFETQARLRGAPLLEVDIEYLQFGGTYLLAGKDARPFIAVTAGLARFDPAPSGFEAENYLSVSFGGGVQLRPQKPVGVRIQARVFATLVDSDEALFCRTGPEANVCAIVLEGEALFQWEVLAGLVFRF